MSDAKPFDSVDDLRTLIAENSGKSLDEVTEDTVIDSLDFDSLDKAELVMAIEEHEERYKVRISDDEATEIMPKTIKEAYDFLQKKENINIY